MKLVVTRPEMRFKLAYIGSGTGGDSDLFWACQPSGRRVEGAAYVRIGGLNTPSRDSGFFSAYCYHAAGRVEKTIVRRKSPKVAMAAMLQMAIERVMQQYDQLVVLPDYHLYGPNELRLFYRHTVQIDL